MSVRPLCHGSFFIHADFSPLTRFQFSAILSSCLKKLNLSGFHFTSHSFRIGAATTANHLGFFPADLRRVGRWYSDRYNSYVRPNLLINSFCSFSFSFSGSSKRIVGHSFIYWAKNWAEFRTYLANLGLNSNIFQVLWWVIRGLRWRNVRDQLIYLSSIWPPPDVLIIHAGAIDVEKLKTWELLCEMKKRLMLFKLLFPHAVLAYSEMIPRLIWFPQGKFHYIDKIRRRLNRTVHNY